MNAVSRRMQSTAMYRFCSICMHIHKVKQAINDNRPNLSRFDTLVLMIKVIWAYSVRNWRPEEYFENDYEHMSKSDLKDFVPVNEYFAFRDGFIRPEACAITEDKWKSYQYFQDYYKRLAFKIPSKAELDESATMADLQSFFNLCGGKSHDFIIKPLALDSGIGVRKLRIEAGFGKEFLLSLVEEYPDGAIVEELINQAEAFAKFHPQSVNTLRINTIRTDNEVHVFLPFLRIGRSGRIIDNTHNGGMLAPIDAATGTFCAAMDMKNNVYPAHPDTHCQIEGTQVPLWDEAQRLAIELAEKFPYTRLVGWDFALTDDGFSVVEVNSYPGIPLVKRHFREEFEWMKRQSYSD